jgi:hypothetical protein
MRCFQAFAVLFLLRPLKPRGIDPDGQPFLRVTNSLALPAYVREWISRDGERSVASIKG